MDHELYLWIQETANRLIILDDKVNKIMEHLKIDTTIKNEDMYTTEELQEIIDENEGKIPEENGKPKVRVKEKEE